MPSITRLYDELKKCLRSPCWLDERSSCTRRAFYSSLNNSVYCKNLRCCLVKVTRRRALVESASSV